MADVKIRILSEDKTKLGIETVNDNFKKMVRRITAVTGTIVLFGVAAKKAFEFAEQGARADVINRSGSSDFEF